ncbi:hypothetical protein QAD02_014802 [Eretmocerus hayati]|uniref:Uncharacterized protein n=1 Tax=Eretmocerus hayati TaxID=131215 RepID=A0ACC2P608_9HYME|nr:hypothetical protein QAD02_014802 [Eretmocerus hayati]
MASLPSSNPEDCKENTPESINIRDGTDTHNHNSCVEKKGRCSDRAMFYKKPISKHNIKLEADLNDTPQEIRRQRILHYQKKNRDASFNVGRGLLEDVFNSENEEMEAEECGEPEEMEIDNTKRKQYKLRKDYARMLMLSEWMLEVPQDFRENWIMVPCPIGKRVLLIARKGSTKMYTRRGVHMHQFQSALPGGNSKSYKNSCTILDCIWSKDREMCYVLDVLAWSNQEMLNCETDFRFFWLRSQIDELPDLKNRVGGVNDYPILTLPDINCGRDFYECLESISTSLPLDGILFYHREAHYTSGRTPLVAWLKTYMLPEVLGVDVPEPYDEKPSVKEMMKMPWNSYLDCKLG